MKQVQDASQALWSLNLCGIHPHAWSFDGKAIHPFRFDFQARLSKRSIAKHREALKLRVLGCDLHFTRYRQGLGADTLDTPRRTVRRLPR